MFFILHFKIVDFSHYQVYTKVLKTEFTVSKTTTQRLRTKQFNDNKILAIVAIVENLTLCSAEKDAIKN